MRHAHHTHYLVIALSLLLVVLAGCGGVGGAGSSASHGATPTTTVNAKGATTPGASATPEVIPYRFAGAWQNAAGPLTISGPSGYAFAPTNQQVGYACAADAAPFNATSDGGATWRAIPATPFDGCHTIFIDGQDPTDVFVAQGVPYTPNPPQTEDQLWRSHDSGATWQKLGMITGTGAPLGWWNLAVVGSRLIGSVYVNGEGGLNDPLFFSDDGGLTWQPLAQSITSQNYSLSQFVAAGATIFIDGMKSNGAVGYTTWPDEAGRQPTSRGAPQHIGFSGSPVNGEKYWSSTDGGATWSPAWTALTFTNGVPTFTRSANGVGYYGLGVTAQTAYDGGNAYDATLTWSSDSGATWTTLPPLRGLENGYVVGGGFTLALAPDGAVFAAADHAGQGFGDDAGIFIIRPNSAAPAWSPLAPTGVQYWQATVSAAGLRLWGVGAVNGDQNLKYVAVA